MEEANASVLGTPAGRTAHVEAHSSVAVELALAEVHLVIETAPACVGVRTWTTLAAPHEGAHMWEEE